MNRRKIALILILIVDVAYIAWGGMAAVSPDGLPGPAARRFCPPALTKAAPAAPGPSFCAHLR
jgi:hypothetical protein